MTSSSPQPAPGDLTADRELAAAVAAGRADEIATFERRFRPELQTIVQRLGVHAEAEELVQILFMRLLVGTDESPAKITSYRGEGSLRSWVRAVSTRFVIDHLRSQRARAPVDPLAEAALGLSARMDGVLEERRFGEDMRAAIESAFSDLTPRQRNLLRHATFHRLTIDELATLYRVHRATTARWLQRTRDELHAAIATKLALATRMAPSEAESLLRGIACEAELSLRSVLSTAFEPDDARVG